MNKRQLQKQKTRELIIEVSKESFIKNGFLNTTTSQIAKAAGIAHGTLFLHFPSKDLLIEEILDNELGEISQEIYNLVLSQNSIETLLNKYLDLISQQEDFFSTIYRELPFYNDKLRRKILFKESIIRSHFFQVIEKSRSDYLQKNEISTAITMLFATVRYYLIMKDSLISSKNVIDEFKEHILSIFLKIIK
ncbi:MAG: TetR/AcrR family transcriptional regulator [Candidatus Cloacimonetes bacterium]|nr:TetR/AcrR family transcriptional regulator [Candidatus Cloacimonadota bacterium]